MMLSSSIGGIWTHNQEGMFHIRKKKQRGKESKQNHTYHPGTRHVFLEMAVSEAVYHCLAEILQRGCNVSILTQSENSDSTNDFNKTKK